MWGTKITRGAPLKEALGLLALLWLLAASTSLHFLSPPLLSLTTVSKAMPSEHDTKLDPK